MGAGLDGEQKYIKNLKKQGKWIGNDKVYSSKFRGNQYVSKTGFAKYTKAVAKLGVGVGVLGVGVSLAQYANGDISGYRATANVVFGVVGIFVPAVGIAYDVLEATYGDRIEDMLWDGRPKN